MRKGKILCVNPKEGRGYIQDENNEEIAFCLTEFDYRIKINAAVLFEIKLTNHGLTAVNIESLTLQRNIN